MLESTRMLREVAGLYYNEGMTQAEIARRFGLSRPKVSRMLAESKELGIVKIFVTDTDEDMTAAENALLKLFSLKAVKVVSVPKADYSLALQITAREAGKYISGFFEDGDIIGVAWGATLYEVSKVLPQLSLKETKVVQLSGNLDNGDTSNFAMQIANNFANYISAKEVYTLPCPAVLGNKIIYDILLHDDKITKIMNTVYQCNKMVVNIGVPDANNCLCKSGYVNEQELKSVLEKGAVGSICCRFYDSEGNICDDQLDSRTVGVSLEQIKASKNVITCAVGENKAGALLAALRAGFIDILVVDFITASCILDMIQ